MSRLRQMTRRQVIGRLVISLLVATTTVGCGGRDSATSASTTDPAIASTTAPSTTATPVVAPDPDPDVTAAGAESPAGGLSEQEIDELERTLDDIDNLLSDLELDLDNDVESSPDE